MAAERALYRVALALVAEGRGEESFPGEREELSRLIDRIRRRLPGLQLSLAGDGASEDDPDPRTNPRVRIEADPRGCLHLESPSDASSWEVANVYPDGDLAEEGGATSFGFANDSQAERPDLPDEVQADLEEIAWRARERGLDADDGPEFEGWELRRELVAPAQPDRPVQIPSAELYSDGLIVRYFLPRGLDPDEPPQIPLALYGQVGMLERAQELAETALGEGRSPRPWISVEDDLGTEYRSRGDGASGIAPVRGTSTLVPAVPADARWLRITSYAGVVELPVD